VERLALLVVGVWLGLLVASSAVATVSFRTADRILGPGLQPELDRRLAGVAAAERRVAFRHLASEVNRWIFRWGSRAQLLLALLLLALLWPTGGGLRTAALALLLLSAFQALGLAGAITSLGRALDFVPRPLPPELGRRFGLLHGAYVLGDLSRLVLLVSCTVGLLRRP
jgi:hypothetical protein